MIDHADHELSGVIHQLKRIADALHPVADEQVFQDHFAYRAVSYRGVLHLRGIKTPDPITFAELCGIDRLVQKLRANTEQFLRGLPCNNVLLYGPRGTGKSSAIKALLNEYAPNGLRMVEMTRELLHLLTDLADLIHDRQEKYIVFCDDLSYGEADGSYRELKAVLEGGLELKPSNMLICATSNRRHLMPEKVADNLPVMEDDELHPSDTLEEKMSLSDRFGLRIGLYTFDADTYLSIVRNYAHLRRLPVDDAVLTAEALQWSLSHGNYSGRTARQFVDDLEGRLNLSR
ncbi:MAG: ATP-binding protein [Nitrospiraceae bacterium]|nr:ATP-binding protein [Nitrospiraceae bacterium]